MFSDQHTALPPVVLSAIHFASGYDCDKHPEHHGLCAPSCHGISSNRKLSLSMPSTFKSHFPFFLSHFSLPPSLCTLRHPGFSSGNHFRYTKFTRVTKPPRTIRSIPLTDNLFLSPIVPLLSSYLPNNNACACTITHVRKWNWYCFGSGRRAFIRRMRPNKSAKQMVKRPGTTGV